MHHAALGSMPLAPSVLLWPCIENSTVAVSNGLRTCQKQHAHLPSRAPQCAKKLQAICISRQACAYGM